MKEPLGNRQIFFRACLLIALTVAARPTLAAATVELELVGDAKGAAMAFQDWAQALGKAGVRNVRLRTAEEPGKPGIVVQGSPENPVYVVTGVVQSRDELELPGRRFRRGEVAQLVQWLNDLAENGPGGGKQAKTAFGLSAAQLERVCKDLAVPVGFATQGMAGDEVARRIAGQMPSLPQLDAQTALALAGDKLHEDLSALSSGTALAYLLRSAGYGLAPRVTDGRTTYTIVKMGAAAEVWPVGRTSDRSDHDALPELFEFHNVNVQNVSLAAALNAIGKLLKAPLLPDHYALARHGLDLDKVKVTLPGGQTTYGLALKRLLFQARLEYEVRYDDAGMPFIWITTLKPV
jgi:hypothetical protein